MNSRRLYELSDCSEYRQTLLARPPRLVRATVVLLVALVTAAVLWAARTDADLVVRAPGRVRPMVHIERLADSAGEESSVSPSRDGRVVRVHVREGDKVQKGQVLVQFETERLRNDLARHQRTIKSSEAELASLKRTQKLVTKRFGASLSKAKAEMTQATSEIRNAKKRRAVEMTQQTATFETARKMFARIEKAYKRGAVTASEYDESKASLKEAKARMEKASLPVDEGKLAVLEHAMDLIRKEYDVEISKIDAERLVSQQKLKAAELVLANLELELRQSELRAPIDGTVTSLKARVGDMIQKGQAALSLVEMRGYRMDLAVGSDDVGHLTVGMRVRVRMDSYDYQKYGTVTGKIVFISPDSQLLKQSAAGPRYIVKVALDADELSRGNHHGRVKLGMTGSAEIITGRENLLALLVGSIRRSISLG